MNKPQHSEQLPARYIYKIDLGAGMTAQPGFIGVDRFAFPGISVICDLNTTLPFKDNSIDFVYASHSLEHIDDLNFTMMEIYRVCKDKAQLCIVAPYSDQSLNIANPYHKQMFNEHTPRFWSDSLFTVLNPQDYEHPASMHFGLSRSDNSAAEINIQCLSIEFFYFPKYRYLSDSEKREARQKYMNVCDQILYHLVVIKAPINAAELIELSEKMNFYEPSYVKARREKELRERQRVSSGKTKDSAEALLHAQLDLMQQRLERTEQLVQSLRESFHAVLNAENNDVVSREQNREDLYVAQLAQRRAEMSEAKLTVFKQKFGIFFPLAKKTYKRLKHKLFTNDLREEISPAFQQLVDDTLLFIDPAQNFKLVIGEDLSLISYTEYVLPPLRSSLIGLGFAFTINSEVLTGHLGLEIITSKQEIIRQCYIPLAEVDQHQPVHFTFEPISDSGVHSLTLRVFAHKIIGEVRIYELVRYKAFGIGRFEQRPFCSTQFS